MLKLFNNLLVIPAYAICICGKTKTKKQVVINAVYNGRTAEGTRKWIQQNEVSHLTVINARKSHDWFNVVF